MNSSCNVQGTPISSLEIISRGKPVISSKTEGSKNLFGKKHELLCDLGDSRQLSNSILEMLTNEKKRNKIRQRNFDIFHSKFQRKQTVQALLDAYIKLYTRQ